MGEGILGLRVWRRFMLQGAFVSTNLLLRSCIVDGWFALGSSDDVLGVKTQMAFQMAGP